VLEYGDSVANTPQLHHANSETCYRYSSSIYTDLSIDSRNTIVDQFSQVRGFLNRRQWSLSFLTSANMSLVGEPGPIYRVPLSAF
jgi:hypothetical protein